MLRSLLVVILALSASWIQATTAHAQSGRRFFHQADYQRLGLQQAWSTQVQLDTRVARVDSVALQVVGLGSYQRLQEVVYRVFEVTYDGRLARFSENDVDASGQVIGRDEAQRLAEKQVILLKARGFKPELTTRDVPPTVIYVQSTAGTLHAIDAENGKSHWAVTVGNPRWPMIAPAANDDYVATVNGSSLYLLDRVTGEPVWDRSLGMNPTMSLAMSNSFIFVPGVNGQLEAYSLPTDQDDHRVTFPWVYHAGSRVTAAPAIGATTVTWGTERGQLFAADLEGPTILFRRQTGGPIFGQAMFLPPDRWVIASTDGYVTAMKENNGAIQWEFATGFDLYQAPISQTDFTYVVTRQNQLFCIDSADGLERWATPGIEQILACGADRLYARGAGGTLVALDKQTGKPIASLAAPDYSVGFSNYLTDRIYMLTSTGTLLCLREEAAYHPTIHRPLPQPPTPTGPAATPPQAGIDPASLPSADDDEDVFGAGAFGVEGADAAVDDPVDADDADDDDADAPEAVEDDPFDFG